MVDAYIVGAAAMLLFEFVVIIVYGMFYGGRKK